jgi:FHS family Na+ dependent glucose MFS transporter 1
MSALHSCFGVGALVAPIIVAWLTLAGYQATQSYFVLAVLLVPIGAFTFALPSPSLKDRELIGRRADGARSAIFSLSLFLFLYVGAEVGFAGWIFTYATTTELGTTTAAAFLTSVFWGSLTAGRALMIPIAARLKPETILNTSLAGALLSLTTMLLGPHSLLMISAATVGLGLSMASIFPATLSFAGQRMKINGSVTGWLVVGSSMGATSIPLLIGQLLTVIGPRSTILVPALALLTAGALFAALQFRLIKSRAGRQSLPHGER